jgi:hypothetical protein
MNENPYSAPNTEVIAPYARDDSFARWSCACLVLVASVAALVGIGLLWFYASSAMHPPAKPGN